MTKAEMKELKKVLGPMVMYEKSMCFTEKKKPNLLDKINKKVINFNQKAFEEMAERRNVKCLTKEEMVSANRIAIIAHDYEMYTVLYKEDPKMAAAFLKEAEKYWER